MKKLLIFMLVLGMASAANATLTWTLSYNEGTGTVDVSVIDHPIASTYIGLAVVAADGVLSSFTIGADAPGNSAFVITYGDAGRSEQGEIWTMIDQTTPYEYPDGSWLTASFAFVGEAISAEVYLDDWTGAAYQGHLDSITIPEPMTVLLLGLGGLFLRRRKGRS